MDLGSDTPFNCTGRQHGGARSLARVAWVVTPGVLRSAQRSSRLRSHPPRTSPRLLLPFSSFRPLVLLNLGLELEPLGLARHVAREARVVVRRREQLEQKRRQVVAAGTRLARRRAERRAERGLGHALGGAPRADLGVDARTEPPERGEALERVLAALPPPKSEEEEGPQNRSSGWLAERSAS